ncbi:MAG: hypothetical protein EOR12_27020 [Mesorhizobium sp.]|uniref:hypothetical protein n=1 Tax=Mesorhizobium sp. TaxID=1871066 RepID=UPI000FE4DA2B|nr:hypothetical protein [Mesorhizobium sp.]RWP84887.1 MAG: hypothetical protein EOR12_27020 [Mesorhizobium sp.]
MFGGRFFGRHFFGKRFFGGGFVASDLVFPTEEGFFAVAGADDRDASVDTGIRSAVVDAVTRTVATNSVSRNA